jgi:predicted CoA-binding protein
MRKLNVLILGASDNPDRHSYQADRLLRECGHSAILVANRAREYEGRQIADNFPLTGTIDVITLYINPAHQTNWKSAILAANPTKVIFNPGTENPDLQFHLSEKGIQWEEACTLVLLHSGQFP